MIVDQSLQHLEQLNVQSFVVSLSPPTFFVSSFVQLLWPTPSPRRGRALLYLLANCYGVQGLLTSSPNQRVIVKISLGKTNTLLFTPAESTSRWSCKLRTLICCAISSSPWCLLSSLFTFVFFYIRCSWDASLSSVRQCKHSQSRLVTHHSFILLLAFVNAPHFSAYLTINHLATY